MVCSWFETNTVNGESCHLCSQQTPDSDLLLAGSATNCHNVVVSDRVHTCTAAYAEVVLAAPTGTEAPNIARLGFHALLIAIAWRRVRHECLDQVARDPRDLCHRALELRLVCL